MLVVFSVLLSVINFYFLVKILSEKPHQKDIQDFQTQTERLMVEFNRITTRNVDLLDSRIEELNHKIRQSQKTEQLLKELFEEAQKLDYLQHLEPSPIDCVGATHTNEGHSSSPIDCVEADIRLTSPTDEIINEVVDDDVSDEVVDDDVINEVVDSLFEGISVKKIKNHRKKSKTSQELLKQYIKENKSKEELLEMGYNINEINLMSLSLVTFLEKTSE